MARITNLFPSIMTTTAAVAAVHAREIRTEDEDKQTSQAPIVGSLSNIVGKKERFSARRYYTAHTTKKAIDPSHPRRARWDLVSAVALLFTAYAVPFEIAFAITPNLALNIVSRVVDMIFVVDIVLNFITAYELSHGRLEYHRKATAIHYLKGWFTLDFIATIPYDLISSAAVGQLGNLKVNMLPSHAFSEGVIGFEDTEAL